MRHRRMPTWGICMGVLGSTCVTAGAWWGCCHDSNFIRQDVNGGIFGGGVSVVGVLRTTCVTVVAWWSTGCCHLIVPDAFVLITVQEQTDGGVLCGLEGAKSAGGGGGQ